MAVFDKVFVVDEPVRVVTTVVLLASAAYVVVTNLRFRRQWPEMAARCRRRVRSLGIDAAALPGIEFDRTFMIVVASFAGALSGALAGLVLKAAVTIVGAPWHVDHTNTDILVGAAFGAFAFALLANED
jgi:hypothetical protein